MCRLFSAMLRFRCSRNIFFFADFVIASAIIDFSSSVVSISRLLIIFRCRLLCAFTPSRWNFISSSFGFFFFSISSREITCEVRLLRFHFTFFILSPRCFLILLALHYLFSMVEFPLSMTFDYHFGCALPLIFLLLLSRFLSDDDFAMWLLPLFSRFSLSLLFFFFFAFWFFRCRDYDWCSQKLFRWFLCEMMSRGSSIDIFPMIFRKCAFLRLLFIAPFRCRYFDYFRRSRSQRFDFFFITACNISMQRCVVYEGSVFLSTWNISDYFT